MATRDFSDMQEKYIAKITNGKVSPNSGGTRFGGGDVLTNKFFIEAKTVEKEKSSFSVKKMWMDKMKEQSFEQGKRYSALAFNFCPEGDNFYIINEKQFLEYLEYIESLED